MKTKMKTKYRSRRYDINRPRSRHGHKYSIYKKCLSEFVKCCICEVIHIFITYRIFKKN